MAHVEEDKKSQTCFSMADLNIISVNCNGLGDKEKRTDVFSYWKMQKPNII